MEIEQHVAHATADHEGLEPFCLQGLHHLAGPLADIGGFELVVPGRDHMGARHLRPGGARGDKSHQLFKHLTSKWCQVVRGQKPQKAGILTGYGI